MTESLTVEIRVEAAALELLRTDTALLAAVLGPAPVGGYDAGIVARRIGTRRNLTADAAYPCVWVAAYAMGPSGGAVTGWYAGAVHLGACTYRPNDPDMAAAKGILGILRGFAQQTDLLDKLNGTATAKATATAIEFRVADVDVPYDATVERVQELVLPVAVICRPSQGKTSG